MIIIDGSQGEGGGQVLRTSLSLSIVTGKPLRIFNIRAGRKKPGLMRQHLTAVQAATQISEAEVQGAEIGSRDLMFVPGKLAPGDYRFSIGTAGSTTLVLQTVLPPLLTASAPSNLTLEGGTHNLASPPYDFLKRAFLPIINRMGPVVKLSLLRPGFYPVGGGQFSAAIRPAEKLASIDILKRGKIVAQKARAMVANLPRHIAERELKVIQKELNLPAADISAIEIDNARGPGNVVFIEIVSEHITEVFSGFGEKGLRAETVAARGAEEAKQYLKSGAPVGSHLADQLLLPFVLAGGGSFITRELSQHSRTNITVIQKFLDIEITVKNISKDQWGIKIQR